MKNMRDCLAGLLSKAMVLSLLSVAVAPWTFALAASPAGDAAKGSKAWSENCARCHNMRSPSDLRDDQWVTSVFHMRIRAGLTGQETRDILAFLQGANDKVEYAGQKAVPLAAPLPATGTGKHIYESYCTACHGADGKGRLPGVPDFTSKNGRLSKSENELFNNVVSGFQSPGSSMPMPPKGGNSNLTEGDIRAVLRYITATFGQPGGNE
ncbi:c-type cytochrome [Shewanella salipaludis]|uniref:C-type cytochrome n=1 Tax=Shewanella salipaludis TaxID=2723052 RepID=A0A972JKD0_9GAMM|nr:c-type cytochrome [Shewanella salipaludis]NMH64989.1 c-type cytochrome [Shewanella salipaludis]